MRKRRTLLKRLEQPHSPEELLVTRLTLLAIATVLLDVAAAVLFYAFEKDVAETDIHSFGDALFWTTSQLTTISSSIRNPVSGAGQILAVGIDLLAISVIALLVSTITNHFHLVSPRKERYFRKRHPERGKSTEG